MQPDSPAHGPEDPAAVRLRIEELLETFLASRRALTTPLGPEYDRLADMLADFVLGGGKRLRPLFAWSGWLAAGGPAEGPQAEAMLRAAAALELVQACALIHDDIIDSSDTRRGRTTVHVAVGEQHRIAGWHGDSAHFGVSVAILLGDLALAWADDLVRESGLSAEAGARVAPVWAAMRTEVLGGQLLDIHSEVRGDETVAAALTVNRYKTAAYTVERPLQLGAAAAGASPELIDDLSAAGVDLGIAFQLRDDLLGVFGDPAVTGKPSGDDLREGKRTVLLAEALRRADEQAPDSAALIRSRIGTDLTAAQVAGLRSVLESLGAVEAIEVRIAELTERAETRLDTLAGGGAHVELLRTLADAATSREA